MPTPSLVIPSAPVYNEGNLYGLNVYGTNFVPEAIPYTRATTATRTNAAGLIELTPYNLLAYSEQFDNAYWLKSNMDVVVNTINAPNETLTADTVIVNATGTQQNIRTFAPFAFNTGVYTQSIYAKKNNINFIYMELGNSYATFNLSTGALSNSGQYSTGWTFVSASSQALDGGWFRFIITSNCTVAGSYSVRVFHPMSTPGSFNYPTLGDSAYIWGAQVVEGTAALPYLRTETRLNVPRVDFSLGGCPNLLLEPQRTNLALQSSSFDNASWVKIATSITANSTTSPSGIADADTLIGNGVSGNHYATQVINMTNGVTYSISVYAKKNTNNFLQIFGLSGQFSNGFANFDLNNGVLGSTGGGATATITSVGNGWYRCTMTATASATSTNSLALSLITSETSPRAESNTLDTSVFLWGAQLEAGAYATSYIPTTTTSVTRNADSFTESNVFSRGMITSAGGTWFMEFRNNVAISRDFSSVSLFIGDSSTGTTNSFSISGQGSVARFRVNKYVAGVFTTLFTTTANTCKIAIKWNGTTADIFENGIKVVNATAFTATALEFLSQIAAEAPKYIQQMALYPTPLSDGELITMTTL